ncbi:hypothetical protein V7S43_003177 [Phytophthora oleae]|uniref:Dienelactone hydrolase domain-containing protein n=1 Tax=Phytophthora oleae TaxID=2107226 RepID=A0ABD3FZN4_9STRA
MVGTRMAVTLGVMALTRSMPVLAQNMSFGANNFYRSDNVTIQPVTFPNQFKMNVAGNLFTPKDLDTSVGAPAIVVGHPMGAVKEQSANLYATKMAEQGFVTLSIDLTFWGGSDGEPRNAVSADLYAESFSAAVDYLGQQDVVDPERIGGLGICGSGSFVISAAKIDSRIKAVATSSMYDMGADLRNGLNHAVTVEQRKADIDEMSRQRSIEAAGGEVQYTIGTTLELTADTHPSNANFTISTAPYAASTRLRDRHRTLRLAHSREFSEDAYASAAEPKELFWVAGAGHVDLYDRVDLIPFDKFTEFFTAGLASNATQSN